MPQSNFLAAVSTTPCFRRLCAMHPLSVKLHPVETLPVKEIPVSKTKPILVAVLILAGAFAPTAHAANFIVNSPADTVDINPGDGACADASAKCTLRAAIMEANALAGPSTITLPVGTHILTIVGIGEDAAATGDLDIKGNLTINGAGAASTIIDGGGIDRVFEILPLAIVMIDAVTVRNGNVDNGGGVSNQGILSMTNTIVTGNSATGGGGIWNNGGTLTIASSTITNNNTFYYGSGVWNYGGNLTMTDSTVSGNSGGGYRCGGVASVGGSATLSNTTINGNTSSGQGAGGFLNWSSASTVVNSTVSGNTGNGYGGGLVNVYSGTLTLVNVTVSGNNDISAAGGISTDSGAVNLKNTIVASNTTGANNSPANCSGTITSLSHNLVSDSTCNLNGTGDLINPIPVMGQLANNGGRTMTHALLPGSPAINAVPVSACTDLNGAPIATDQRGIPRPQGPACDIGAFELVATPQGNTAVIITQVQVLVAAGTLTPNQAAGLIDKLNQIIAKLNNGQPGLACNQLSAFINQVKGFVNSGVLTPTQGQALINPASAIKTQIGC